MQVMSDATYRRITDLMYSSIGLSFNESKKPLVTSRLASRVERLGLDGFEDYFELISGMQNGGEFQMAVDLLTTNETYFFREIKHFEFMRAQAIAARSRPQPYRVWSAASSSGEEAYSMAMVLMDCMQTTPWEILGTDISTRVLEGARRALYSLERGRHIPPEYLRRFCRKGSGQYDGHLLVDGTLRSKVMFRHLNLNTALPQLGQFDLVFLRNVMIYFNNETKREVVARVISTLKPGGYFCIGHSESLNDISTAVQMVAPSIYQKPL